MLYYRPSTYLIRSYHSTNKLLNLLVSASHGHFLLKRENSRLFYHWGPEFIKKTGLNQTPNACNIYPTTFKRWVQSLTMPYDFSLHRALWVAVIVFFCIPKWLIMNNTDKPSAFYIRVGLLYCTWTLNENDEPKLSQENRHKRYKLKTTCTNKYHAVIADFPNSSSKCLT